MRETVRQEKNVTLFVPTKSLIIAGGSATPTEITNEEGARWLLRFLHDKHDAEVLYTIVEELARTSRSICLTKKNPELIA